MQIIKSKTSIRICAQCQYSITNEAMSINKYHSTFSFFFLPQNRMPHRGERRDGEGRHVLPDHDKKAGARPGDCGREQPAVYLSGGQRRSQSAEAGRDFPRQDALRTDILQSGEYERKGNPADCRCNGKLHRRFVYIYICVLLVIFNSARPQQTALLPRIIPSLLAFGCIPRSSCLMNLIVAYHYYARQLYFYDSVCY